MQTSFEDDLLQAYINFFIDNSDIFFDKISSIKALDKQQVYDLEIEGTHNFIANDIVAHNTNADGNTPIWVVDNVSGGINLGQSNVRAYPHLLINNTGNEDFDMVNMTAAALTGTTTTTENIGVTSFGVNLTNSSNGDLALNFPADGIVNLRQPAGYGADTGKNVSFLHGHTSAFAPNADKGNISAFIWVDVPSSGISPQLYNATWNVTAINNP